MESLELTSRLLARPANTRAPMNVRLARWLQELHMVYRYCLQGIGNVKFCWYSRRRENRRENGEA